MADQVCPSSSSTQNNLVEQLCRLVENLHEQNNTMQRRADTRDNRPETVREATSRLYPSVINRRSNSSDPITTNQAGANGFHNSSFSNLLFAKDNNF